HVDVNWRETRIEFRHPNRSCKTVHATRRQRSFPGASHLLEQLPVSMTCDNEQNSPLIVVLNYQPHEDRYMKFHNALATRDRSGGCKDTWPSKSKDKHRSLPWRLAHLLPGSDPARFPCGTCRRLNAGGRCELVPHFHVPIELLHQLHRVPARWMNSEDEETLVDRICEQAWRTPKLHQTALVDIPNYAIRRVRPRPGSAPPVL